MEYDAFDAEEKLITWEPDAEIGDAAAWRPVETKAASLATEAIPGTLEEHREAVRMAVQEALRGEGETGDDGKTRWNSVQLVATFPDKAIVRRYRWDDGAESEETYAVPYSFTDNGSVTLGEPEPVVIRAHIEGMDKPEPGEIAEELDEHPAVGLVEDATYAVKALGAATLETKAGRVLSRVNEQRLRDAITHLLAVCGVAGVQVDLPSQKQADDAQGKVGGKAPEPSFQPDTTSVEARETKTRLTPAEVAEAMALMASLP